MYSPTGAAALRAELCARALRYASSRQRTRFQQSYGQGAVVAFEPAEDGAGHGNFHPASYAAIAADQEWARRLSKRHTGSRRSLPPCDRGYWCETDSCNSSDALLMNVFCHPRSLGEARLRSLLGVERGDRPRFGVRARVPLVNGNQDATEVDMAIGGLLVEAKLTETDFQAKPLPYLERYRDFREVFNARALPRRRELVQGYQLVRNILAAHALGRSFVVLLDARRPDLREQCAAVFARVKPIELRTRCQVLLWQELAAVLPGSLREFLDEKYGIQASGFRL